MDRAQYVKAWRAANPDKVIAANKAYHARNPGKKAAVDRAWRARNPGKSSAYSRAWQARNPDTVLSRHLMSNYGLSLEEYRAMVAKQKGQCAVCKAVPKKLAVDHCHASDRVRGLLCRTCNIGLGMFNDSPVKLKQAIKYLKSRS